MLEEMRIQNTAFRTSYEGESLGAFVARIVGDNKKLKQELEDHQNGKHKARLMHENADLVHKANDLSGQLDMQKAFMNAAITQRDEAYEQIAKLRAKLQIKKMKEKL